MTNRFFDPLTLRHADIGQAWLWCLLFGSLYFAAKGARGHAILAFVMAVLTLGLSWLVYPFFARGILATHYLKNGWIQVE